MKTALAVADPDNCADCGVRMPERGENTPEVRRCQDCWYIHQATLPLNERHWVYRERPQ